MSGGVGRTSPSPSVDLPISAAAVGRGVPPPHVPRAGGRGRSSPAPRFTSGSGRRDVRRSTIYSGSPREGDVAMKEDAKDAATQGSAVADGGAARAKPGVVLRSSRPPVVLIRSPFGLRPGGPVAHTVP